MPLKVFIEFCILGIDFMIYPFFQWTYGDKRNALARQITAQKNGFKEQSQRPFLVRLQDRCLRKTTSLTSTQKDFPITRNQL